MKKIICYIDMMNSTGGAQRVMKNLITHLINKNYNVILVNDFDIEYQENSFIISNKVKKVFLKNDNNGNLLTKNIERIINLRRLVKEENPDIILSFLGRPDIRMLLATLGINVKKIVSVRNDPNYEYGKGWIKKTLINLLFRQADGCVFQTEDAASYFNKKTQEKSKVIFNPVDPLFFEVERSKECRGIVTFGRLEKQKNHKLLIKVYSSLLKKNENLEDLFIYGNGELRGELERIIVEEKIQNKVHLPGSVSNVVEILSKSKLFILSSDFEGLPNALMEAMACGTPVISTDCPCGGPKMLITNDNEGILVGCNNAKELEDAVQSIIYNEEKLEEMSIAAKKRAKSFEPLKVFQEWEEYLNLICEE